MEGRLHSVDLLLVALVLALVVDLGSVASVPWEHPVSGAGIAPGVPIPLKDATGSPGPLIRQGLVLPVGPLGAFDEMQVGFPTILFDGGVYRMWYLGCDTSYTCRIGYAVSADGRAWTKSGPVLSPSLPQEGKVVSYPDVVRVGDEYWMWYNGFDGSNVRILAANSSDGIVWAKHGVVLDAGAPGSLDAFAVAYPQVVLEGTEYRMWYTGVPAMGQPGGSIIGATSPDGVTWTKGSVVLSPGASGALDQYAVASGPVEKIGLKYEMVYVGGFDPYTSRLFYAESSDGAAWQKLGLALDVLPPQEALVGGPGAVVEANGTWSVWYTARRGYSDLQIYLAISDNAAPVTAAALAGTVGQHDWFVSGVRVSLNATDDLSGVRATNYSLDGGTESAYSAPFLVSGDGVHHVTYRSVDVSGNEELPKTVAIPIDTTPPSVRIEAPTHSTRSEVTLSLNGSDATSGIDRFEVSVDGGPFQSVGTYTSVRRSLEDGDHEIRVQVFDLAGNVGTATIALSVDTNIFSFAGPYSGIPTYSLIAGAIGVTVWVAWSVSRRRPIKPPPSAP